MEEKKRLKLLIADDEEGMRTGVRRALRNYEIICGENGAEVVFDLVEASSGEEAISVIERETPDLVLLDNKMGGISGIDVLTWINERDLDLMAIMITAYASIETAITATKQGAYDFLPKPFTPAELKVSVRQAAEHLLTLRHTRALEAEKRRVRFQFISVLAHELKAPLGAIEGYLNILRDGTGTDDPKVFARVVERSLVRLSGMRKLIYDLLDLTRLESGQKKRELTEVDLREVAETALETMKPDADSRDIRMELDAGDAMILQADRGEMEIVFNNLISNAVKYNRDQGSVTVTIRKVDAEGSVEISVSDTGIGLSKEEVQKLFGEFVRIKNDKTRNILGSGLGLSILRKIAGLYEGEVSVESIPDQGSTFTVTLRGTLRGK